MTGHAVAIAGGGPTAMMLAGVDVLIIERRARQDLDSSRAGRLYSRTIVVLNQRGIADRVQVIDATYAGTWELPVLGQVAAPAAVLIRPDGYAAWVGNGAVTGLREALTPWFGSP
jgi:2-polyprenyl-6-methoxyphenol hydroxylase-like FAD-dependent oxidoreductase